MPDDDDERSDLLADEERVRDALLAAVDVQLVPPVHTNLAEIVARGRRRARLQVVSASVAAVVLIGAVALGATVLGGRLGGDHRVDTANDGSTSLPVTSPSSIATAPNAPPPNINEQYFGGTAACVYPALVGKGKWVPLNQRQTSDFDATAAVFASKSALPITPAIADVLPDEAKDSTTSVEIPSRDQPILVTLTASGYSGPLALAAQQDAKRTMPSDCVGAPYQHSIGKTMLYNEYTPVPIGKVGQAAYYRIQLYSDTGIRYDVTEAVDAPNAITYKSAATPETAVPTLSMSGTALRDQESGIGVPPALSMSELLNIALQVSNLQ